MKKHTPQHTRGFTLLFAVLISSILLSIGVAIFSITVRELRLSSVVRESQFAAYTADSGIECALYWGLKQGAFSTSTTNTFTCNGQAFSGIGGGGYGATSTFMVSYASTCSVVAMGTHLLSDDRIRTIVESRGYNVACGATSTSPNAVERAVRVFY